MIIMFAVIRKRRASLIRKDDGLVAACFDALSVVAAFGRKNS